MSDNKKEKTSETEEYSPEVYEALDRLHVLDDKAEDLGHVKYLEQLSQFEEEFKELGMLQNILSRQGEILYSLERYDEAEPKLKRAIELGDRDPRDRFILHCLHFLGGCYFELKKYDKAMTAFDEAECLLKYYEDDGSKEKLFAFCGIKGQTYSILNQNKQAIKWLKKACKLANKCEVPTETMNWVYYDLTQAYCRSGHPRSALKVLRKVNEETVDEKWISLYYSIKCRVLCQMHLNTELVKVANQYIKLSSEDDLAEAWNYYGRGNHMLGNKAEALRSMVKSLEYESSLDWVHKSSKEYLSKHNGGVN